MPAGSPEETFAAADPRQQEIYHLLVEHLRSLPGGDQLHEDAVSVGVLLKRDRTFAEARPRPRGLALWLWLERPLDDPLVTRVIRPRTGRRVANQAVLRSRDDLGPRVLDWLTEAFLLAGPG